MPLWRPQQARERLPYATPHPNILNSSTRLQDPRVTSIEGGSHCRRPDQNARQRAARVPTGLRGPPQAAPSVQIPSLKNCVLVAPLDAQTAPGELSDGTPHPNISNSATRHPHPWAAGVAGPRIVVDPTKTRTILQRRFATRRGVWSPGSGPTSAVNLRGARTSPHVLCYKGQHVRTLGVSLLNEISLWCTYRCRKD